ncbi:M6 family metalloprotease domain-containing protein [bacterium]|nr:M6 family metalloprotease domain-containing protein [candidate division CSSED10-310 bacterium]
MSNFKRILFTLICAGAVSIMVHSTLAAPPVPGTYDPETMMFYETGLPVPVEISQPGPLRAPGSYRGVWKFPVLFIHANDIGYTYSVAEWSAQLFTVGTYPTGSMRDYYREVSYGNFDIDGPTLGWMTADYDYDHYVGGNFGFDGGAAELAREAVEKAEATYNPNWAEFDNDGDGNVDGVVIIHQGPGGENGNPDTIWSHVSGFEPLELDGVTLSRYSIQPETKPTGVMETIGTICHEHGHILGLPDLYDVAYTAKYTPIGNWCIMAGGSNGGQPMGARPNHFCAWSKYKLGWVNVTTIDTAGTFTSNYVQNNQNNSVYRILINGDENEYFIISNRWMDHTMIFDHMPDRFLGGLMIYHCDDNIPWSNNGESEFWHVVLEDAEFDTASGDMEGEDIADCGFSADDGNTAFGRYTQPNSNGNYLPSNIVVNQIGNRGAVMGFSVGFAPTIILNDYEIIAQGNKQYHLEIELINLAAVGAGNVQATLSTTATNVVIDTATSGFGSIPKNGGTATNDTTPFVYHTTGDEGSLEQFTIVVTADGGYTSTDLTFTIPVNPSRILIVDDDQTRKAEPQDIEQFFVDPLNILGYEFEIWEVLTLGYPSAGILNLYDLVIWSDGKANANTPKPGMGLDELTEFLDMGGDLFWSSHEFIYSQYSYSDENPVEYVEFPDGSFCREYLHLLAAEQDEYFYEAYGVPGSMFDGITFEFDDVFSGTNMGWWPDEFVTDGTSIPILTAGSHECDPEDTDCLDDSVDNTLSNAHCAFLYQGEYRLMFMSVPVHGISTETPAPANRQQFMKKVFEWFGITRGADATPGIDIDLNSQMYHAGDEFKLTLKIDNPGSQVTADVYVLLDVYGQYFYFWPTWGESLNFDTRDLPTGYESTEILMQFDWPSGAGAGSNIRFWAALLDHTTSQLLGNYDFCPAAWE